MDDEDSFGRNDESIFEKVDEIGRGTYGTVFKGILKETGETIAIKKIHINLENEGIPSTALREITILRELNHPSIVELKDVVCDDNQLYLLFEYFDSDLRKYMINYSNMNNGNCLDEKQIKSFMFQLLDGVAYCHARKIFHRDLKPQNILIDKNGKLKIADFGLARTFSIPVRPYTKEVLTLFYRGPELILGSSEYTTAVDIWSLGCIFAEMYLNSELFRGDNELEQWQKMNEILGSPTYEMWPDLEKMPGYNGESLGYPGKKLEDVIPNMDETALNLLSQMIVYDPSKRITAKQALLHPYFTGGNAYGNKKYAK